MAGNVFPIYGGGGPGGFNVPSMAEMRAAKSANMGGRPERAPVVTSQDERNAMLSVEAPRIPWDVFLRTLDWKQGEHVGLIGPTGSGKTSTLINLLNLRTFVAVTATKPRDETMDQLISQGYLKLDKWEAIAPQRAPRRVIWPDARDINSDRKQIEVFRHMFASAYREGGWCIACDEGFTMADTLGLKREMKQIWTQGRSLGVSFVVATQRPRWVPLEMYDQSTHLFFWQNSDRRSLDTLGDINRRNSDTVKEVIMNLEKYQLLYVNTRTGAMMRTSPPAPSFNTGGR